VSVRLGVIADIHGNDVALRAVLADASRFGVERWWALGDLVLFGPRPAEVLEILRELPGIGMLRGNTDRYVLTGEQPAPHETVADAAGSADLERRYAGMAAGIGWTRGVLDQAGLLWVLDGLPAQLRLRLPGGASVLGVHASPRADDGRESSRGSPASSSGRCSPGLVPRWSSAAILMPPPTASSAASAPSTPAAPGCRGAVASRAGCSSRAAVTD